MALIHVGTYEPCERVNVIPSYRELAVNELELRLRDRTSFYDLSQERNGGLQFVFATITRSNRGKIEHEARTVEFFTHRVTELKRTMI